ncbi:MAG: PDZ domain-containing protein [Planctomycetota bacterium]
MKHTLMILGIACLSAFAANADDEKKDPAPPAPQIESREKLDEILRKLLGDELDGEQIKALATEDLRSVMDELLRLHAQLSKQVGGMWSGSPFSGPLGFGGPGIVIETRPGARTTMMRGSFTKDGAKGSYTLRSAGRGKYELSATLTGDDGISSDFTDSGTMQELQKRHPFLKLRSSAYVFFGDTTGKRSPLPRFALSPFDLTSRPSTSAILELGVTVRKPAPELAFHLGLPAETGLVIERVIEGGRADKLGLRRFDVLLSIDGELITEARDLRKVGKPGTQATLEIVRRTKKRELKIGAGNLDQGANPRGNR